MWSHTGFKAQLGGFKTYALASSQNSDVCGGQRNKFFPCVSAKQSPNFNTCYQPICTLSATSIMEHNFSFAIFKLCVLLPWGLLILQLLWLLVLSDFVLERLQLRSEVLGLYPGPGFCETVYYIQSACWFLCRFNTLDGMQNATLFCL